MITRKQWSNFCADLSLLKKWGLKISINGKPIWQIRDNIIKSRYDAGDPYPMIYTYDDSLMPYTTLKDLYNKIDVENVKALHFRPVFKVMFGKGIFK